MTFSFRLFCVRGVLKSCGDYEITQYDNDRSSNFFNSI